MNFLFRSYPFRLQRFGKAIITREKSFKLKFFKILVLFGDLILLPDVYESLMDWLKWKTRPLTLQERLLGQTMYGNIIPWDMIRMDEKAIFGPKQYKIAYVSFFTINSDGRLAPKVFIHELMHVIQYLQYGSAYIPMALMAQRSESKYNYGGAEALLRVRENGGQLWDLNLEQQADVMADYFALQNGLSPKWTKIDPALMSIFEKFRQDIFRLGERAYPGRHTKA